MADSSNKRVARTTVNTPSDEHKRKAGTPGEGSKSSEATKKMTPAIFMNKVLSGTALGVIIGLIPNAVLSGILKYFGTNTFAVTLTQIAVIFQLATPLIIGGLIALQFEFNPMQMMVTAAASFVGSGVVKFNPALKVYVGAGTGDLINTMITASLAVIVLMWVKDKFGSTAVVAMPILVGCGVAYVGVLLLPFIAAFTAAIGNVINSFTTLQPIFMAILICCSFATIIISPISTVAIGLAIQLNGVSAGAAAMGVAATALALVVYSWTVNKSGVTLAIALGAMKLMMPNLFKYPIILVPCLFTAIISAVPVALFSISGTPQSSGFGIVGLVGPLAAMEAGLAIPLMILCWLIIPIAAALLSKLLFEKMFRLFDSKIVFKFQG
ncbi:PTS sugar transporter subunit IIC [Lacticaseibacillus rhamnosus]|uniref:PTS sugar transporter subunit IIC n=1 Tax=Lacticaseibacillus rhamnosus TaxID=47715 RepID=UPI0009C0C6CD|nr:PTS sugar transporter subunit IIC [Lacticaseibacillus rhamnosus]MBB1164270.1 PTS sugar transporter subunit IIC [Lacticaseibacillus rhamnosus]MCZ2731953.1 PTS sugar transporter subunit IIC [Lacticaseibacillus rhamnosus]MCZ2734872.1 PTS sugar transporter subunit IIC [Lacticaseibacillus rhamnosus]MCZ2741238.1 PTS sugar transporter subunit IIC [Lacticaseibacillus rhamnosus]MCZ2743712.1 PTS sugar transporter subunit IIC [Lacticaseibacillus rhamnosus]